MTQHETIKEPKGGCAVEQRVRRRFSAHGHQIIDADTGRVVATFHANDMTASELAKQFVYAYQSAAV